MSAKKTMTIAIPTGLVRLEYSEEEDHLLQCFSGDEYLCEIRGPAAEAIWGQLEWSLPERPSAPPEAQDR